MGFFSTVSRRLGIAGELLSFFARNKRWWMLPVILVVLFTSPPFLSFWDKARLSRRSSTPSSRRIALLWPIFLLKT